MLQLPRQLRQSLTPLGGGERNTWWWPVGTLHHSGWKGKENLRQKAQVAKQLFHSCGSAPLSLSPVYLRDPAGANVCPEAGAWPGLPRLPRPARRLPGQRCRLASPLAPRLRAGPSPQVAAGPGGEEEEWGRAAGRWLQVSGSGAAHSDGPVAAWLTPRRLPGAASRGHRSPAACGLTVPRAAPRPAAEGCRLSLLGTGYRWVKEGSTEPRRRAACKLSLRGAVGEASAAPPLPVLPGGEETRQEAVAGAQRWTLPGGGRPFAAGLAVAVRGGGRWRGLPSLPLSPARGAPPLPASPQTARPAGRRRGWGARAAPQAGSFSPGVGPRWSHCGRRRRRGRAGRLSAAAGQRWAALPVVFSGGLFFGEYSDGRRLIWIQIGV